MNWFTRISFFIFKYGAFGMAIFYLLGALLVGSAEHRSGDSISIYYVLAYSLFLFLLIRSFEKHTKSEKIIGMRYKIIFILMVVPPILLAMFLSIYLLIEWISYGILILPVVLVLGPFASFGIVILKYVLFTNNKIIKED